MAGIAALALQPDDYHGHKDVAVSSPRGPRRRSAAQCLPAAVEHPAVEHRRRPNVTSVGPPPPPPPQVGIGAQLDVPRRSRAVLKVGALPFSAPRSTLISPHAVMIYRSTHVRACSRVSSASLADRRRRLEGSRLRQWRRRRASHRSWTQLWWREPPSISTKPSLCRSRPCQPAAALYVLVAAALAIPSQLPGQPAAARHHTLQNGRRPLRRERDGC